MYFAGETEQEKENVKHKKVETQLLWIGIHVMEIKYNKTVIYGCYLQAGCNIKPFLYIYIHRTVIILHHPHLKLNKTFPK